MRYRIPNYSMIACITAFSRSVRSWPTDSCTISNPTSDSLRSIALHLVAEELARLGIETGDAENDPILVEDDPDLCSLRGGRAVVGVALAKIGCGRGLLPGRFVGDAVEHDRFALDQPMCLNLRPRALRGNVGTDHTETQNKGNRTMHCFPL